jgi:tetratricopeptide (TPR) repeat protein
MTREAEHEEIGTDDWSDTLVFAGLVIVCLVIYWQTTGFAFINLDDPSYVYRNTPILNGINTESVKWAFTAFHSSNWHPITWLSHALDVQLFGLNPGAHHAVNVMLHIANSCLAFVVFRRMTGAVWPSAMVAFLFAAHPIHVESVAWISERKDVLSTLFWLLTMLAYTAYARTADGSIAKRISSKYFVLTFVLLGLGLMAKPMLVTLPFVLLLADIWPLRRAANVRDLGRLFLEKIPLFALVIASSVITFFAQRASGSVLGLDRFPLESRIVNSLAAYGRYLGSMFYPADLGVWYPFDPVIDKTFFATVIVLLTAITALAIWQIGKRGYIAFGWFWFLGTMVPVIGLVQVGAQSMADRYTYIPYFGLFVIVVWGASEVIEKVKLDRRIVVGVAGLVVIALTAAAFVQTRYWRNNETLYTRTIAVTKDNYFLMNLLCKHYVDTATAEIAERRCTELVGNTSNYMESHNTIGLLRAELGRYDDAIVSYRKALMIQPRAAIVYLHLSASQARKGETSDAEKSILRAIDLADPEVANATIAKAYVILGESYFTTKDNARAKTAFENALRFDAEQAAAKTNLEKLNGAN